MRLPGKTARSLAKQTSTPSEHKTALDKARDNARDLLGRLTGKGAVFASSNAMPGPEGSRLREKFFGAMVGVPLAISLAFGSVQTQASPDASATANPASITQSANPETLPIESDFVEGLSMRTGWSNDRVAAYLQAFSEGMSEYGPAFEETLEAASTPERLMAAGLTEEAAHEAARDQALEDFARELTGHVSAMAEMTETPIGARHLLDDAMDSNEAGPLSQPSVEVILRMAATAHGEKPGNLIEQWFEEAPDRQAMKAETLERFKTLLEGAIQDGSLAAAYADALEKTHPEKVQERGPSAQAEADEDEEPGIGVPGLS